MSDLTDLHEHENRPKNKNPFRSNLFQRVGFNGLFNPRYLLEQQQYILV